MKIMSHFQKISQDLSILKFTPKRAVGLYEFHFLKADFQIFLLQIMKYKNISFTLKVHLKHRKNKFKRSQK